MQQYLYQVSNFALSERLLTQQSDQIGRIFATSAKKFIVIGYFFFPRCST